ncbi:hypothetical protein EDD16DRAFT_1646374 [Pisolithus croceorrhizus]|nr:hypothetical protein EDD16DRAFT_1646374 [Pisolithus croceorrhizus]
MPAICLALTTSILGGVSSEKAVVDPSNPVSTGVFIAHTSNHSAKNSCPPTLHQMRSSSIHRVLRLRPPRFSPRMRPPSGFATQMSLLNGN